MRPESSSRYQTQAASKKSVSSSLSSAPPDLSETTIDEMNDSVPLVDTTLADEQPLASGFQLPTDPNPPLFANRQPLASGSQLPSDLKEN